MYFKGRPVVAAPLDPTLKGTPLVVPQSVIDYRAAGFSGLLFYGDIRDQNQIRAAPSASIQGDTSFCRSGYPLTSQNVLLLVYQDDPALTPSLVGTFNSLFTSMVSSLAGTGVDVVLTTGGNLVTDVSQFVTDSWAYPQNGRAFSGKLLVYGQYLLSQYVAEMDLANPPAAPLSYTDAIADAPPVNSDETQFLFAFEHVPFTAPDPRSGFAASVYNTAEEFMIAQFLSDISGDDRFSAQRLPSLTLPFVQSFFGL